MKLYDCKNLNIQ